LIREAADVVMRRSVRASPPLRQLSPDGREQMLLGGVPLFPHPRKHSQILMSRVAVWVHAQRVVEMPAGSLSAP